MAELTREAILAMKSGPELDAAVSESIFGEHICITEATPDGIRCKQMHKHPRIAYWISEKPCPPYSTDIAAAWEVVERLRDAPLRRDWNGTPGQYVRMTLTHSKKHVKAHVLSHAYGVSATGATAPEAICKAALLAILEEGERS